MKTLSALFFALTLTFPAVAGTTNQTKTLLNVDSSGVAVQGYDPVAFFTDHKPMMGKPAFLAKYHGATYLFDSKEHKDAFNLDPAKYEPAYGGYCAYGVSRNKLVEVDVEAYQIVDGRLLMQYSKSVQKSFNEDVKGNLGKAESNWPGLVEKKGK